MHPARRWLVFLSAAILTVLLPVTVAPAAAASAAGTRVGAHHPAMILAVGASRPVSAGQRQRGPASQPQIAAGACVAAEDARAFYTVQDAADAARLRSGGEPWPTSPSRAALGPGVYSFADRAGAEAYANVLGSRGTSNLEILQFRVSESDLASMRSVNIDSLENPEDFMSKYSQLWDGTPNHGYDWVMRGTQFGQENYFSSSVFDMLRFGGGK